MKKIGYEWRLRELMAAAGLFTTTKLSRELKERGIELSASQVYRLAAEKPERLNLHVLVALMDILGCTADDLVQRVELGHSSAMTGTNDLDTAGTSDFLRTEGFRPKRARIVPDHEA